MGTGGYLGRGENGGAVRSEERWVVSEAKRCRHAPASVVNWNDHLRLPEQMGKTRYTAISVFTGAMGLDIGFEQTGRFRLLACVEKNPTFCETIRRNRDAGRIPGGEGLRVYEADMATFDPHALLADCGLKPGELDVLVGGPPCQAFSTAGRRQTVQDPRGELLWDFLRCVEVLRPKFFLMENVRGLLSAALKHRPIKQRPEHGGPPLTPEEEPGSVVRLFADDLFAIPHGGYRVDCFEVNAVNYGAPQLRERVLFIGNRYGDAVEFPDPTHGQSEDAPQSDLFSDARRLLPFRTLRDAIGGLKEESPVIMDFSPRKKSFLALVPPGSNWRSLPEDLQKESMGKAFYAKGGRSGWWRRLSYDLPCPTVVTMPNHASTALCHPEEVRALTLRECAMIQEFPPDWEFAGKAIEQYEQVGNAVPVRLGTVAGDVIAGRLDALRSRSWRPYAQTGEHFRVVYVSSHIRTRQWYKGGEVFVWKDGRENEDATYSAPKTRRSERKIV